MSPRLRDRLYALAVALVPAAIATLVALAVGSVLVRLYGGSPIAVWAALLRGTWGNGYGIGELLQRTTVLVFTGLAVALPFEARLFNIGAEGQLALGGFAAALVGARVGSWPAIVALTACALAAAIAGGLAGLLPGVLRARTGAHEVITTIMLNALIAGVLLWVGTRWLFLREQLHTAPIAPTATLRRLATWLPSLHGSKASTGLLLAALLAIAYHLLITRTVFGLRLRAVGQGALAAAAAAVRVDRMTSSAFALAGALAGLGGFVLVCGTRRYYEAGLGGGAGFLGIAVAVLGRGRALGIVLAALLFGTLAQGGFALSSLVPRELVLVLQAVVILVVASAAPACRRWLTLPTSRGAQ